MERGLPVGVGPGWQPTRVLVCTSPAADYGLTWPGMNFAWAACDASGPVLRWLMLMGFRSSLAAVVASVLFAAAWAVCDQLAGLGVSGSSAVAGVLAIVTFGLTLRLTRPDRPDVGRLQSAHANPSGLRRAVDTQLPDVAVERAARPGERGHGFPDKSRITPEAREIPARERTRRLVTQQVQFIVDDAGMQVQGKRKTIGGEVWEEYLRIRWSAVTVIGFAIGSHDSIPALYVWTAAGKPAHVADSRRLGDLEWAQLGELIIEATRGRLTLDVASRHNPKSVWPDW
jgi:hypothetical protein